MVYSDREYGYLYQQYKKAESEIGGWIKSRSPPNPNGGDHCFSRLGELARELYKNGKVEMPEELRVKLKHSIELRIKLVAHHNEKGDANTEHIFAIVMFGKIAQALFPPSDVLAITRLVQSVQSDSVTSGEARGSTSPTERSRSAPGGAPRWQQATSWRSKSQPDLRQANIEGSLRGRTKERRPTY